MKTCTTDQHGIKELHESMWNQQQTHYCARSTKSRSFVTLILLLSLGSGSLWALGQKRPKRTAQKNVSLTSHSRDSLTPEAREMVELASGIVCKERITDPRGSVPIDDMQGRPSLPVRSPEALAGAQRAQRLLPVAKTLVVLSLKRLSTDYGFRKSRAHDRRLQRAIAHVQAVKNIRPDVDSRDNASVFLRNPRTIVFGTIFLAGLPSDEGIISVLAHELVHIADGSEDSLNLLFAAVGIRASQLTGMKVHDQRAEELTCDLVGAIAARSFIAGSPNYEPLARRISRSMEHNCVSQDEGDEDHLSPRNTIRALLTLDPALSRELVFGR
jgi:Zn-dependent protease with chaperone function